MADKDSLTAKWITRTKDTVTSMKDQEEIATTFCVHAVSRLVTQIMLQRNPALVLPFSNAVIVDKIMSASMMDLIVNSSHNTGPETTCQSE